MGRVLISLLAAWFPLASALADEPGEVPVHCRVIGQVVRDHDEFYSSNCIRHLALGLAVAWVLANTEADVEIQDWCRENLNSQAGDDFSRLVKPLGNGRIAAPVLAGVVVMGKLAEDAPGGAAVHGWAGHSLRALLVGAPPVLFLQVAIGSSRPRENDSRWRPFEDDNGVSGHAFVGAIPFLSAARMTRSRALKALCWAGSALCGWSRINDDAHYFSQAAMGWWMAYLAAGSVEQIHGREQKLLLQPIISSDAAAIQATFSF